MLFLKLCFLKYISLLSTHTHDQLFVGLWGRFGIFVLVVLIILLTAGIHLSRGGQPLSSRLCVLTSYRLRVSE